MDHIWRQDGYIVAGILEGLTFPCPVQKYRCENCDDTISLPDCNHSFCKDILSEGCTHEKTREEIPHADNTRMQGLQQDEEVREFHQNPDRSSNRHKHGSHKR